MGPSSPHIARAILGKLKELLGKSYRKSHRSAADTLTRLVSLDHAINRAITPENARKAIEAAWGATDASNPPKLLLGRGVGERLEELSNFIRSQPATEVPRGRERLLPTASLSVWADWFEALGGMGHARKPSVEAPLRLPPILSVLSHEHAAHEYMALIHALLHHEAQRQGCKTLPYREWSVSTTGFATSILSGRFDGLEPVVNVSASASPSDLSEFDDTQAWLESLEVRKERDLRVKHWIFLTPEKRVSEEWERLRALLKERGIKAHNFTQCDFEPWLFHCEPLLARFYPADAVKLPGEHGFAAVEFGMLQSEFIAKELPRHRKLSLLGMPPRYTQHQEKPTPLSEVFVPQKFRPYGTTEPRQSLAALLRTERPCILLGDPGSGKTTVLHYLALLHAGEVTLPEASCDLRVPLFLPLRQFSKGQAKRPTFVEALVHESVRRGLTGVHRWFFEALLLMGGAVVLLDGLDEAGDHRTRTEIAHLIGAFQRQYPACPIWVTSRIVGYADTARLDDQTFAHYSVTDFGPEEQELFIGKWYDVQMPNDSDGRHRKKRRFLQAVDKVPAVRRLAGNPLLLTLMALVHHYQNELPRNRGELYEQCVEMLLKHWQQTKNSFDSPEDARSDLPPEKLEPPIYTEDSKKLLAAVALKVQQLNERNPDESARGDIKESLLRKICEDRRAKLIAGRYPTSEQQEHAVSQAREDITLFLDYVRERSGLLIWRGGDTYAFAHLSFLEFLAAYQQSGDRLISLLDQAKFFREKAALPAWRETLIQFLYLLAKNTGEDSFVDVLLGPEVSADAPAEFWRTLGTAVSDELVPAASQVTRILEHLWLDWSAAPEFSGDAYAVLGQIAEFGEPSRRNALRLALINRFQEAPLEASLRALHLRIRLFAWPSNDPAEASALAGQVVERLKPERAATHWERAGYLLTDADPDVVAAEPVGKACVALVRERLLGLMLDSRRPSKDRAASGRILGHLGDPRLGVTPQTVDDLAQMEFCYVPPDRAGSLKRLGKDTTQPPNKGFWIARFPVTVAQFRLFATRENYAKEDWWEAAKLAGFRKDGQVKVTVWDGSNERLESYSAALDPRFDVPNHPVVEVNWFEAMAFAAWLRQQLRASLELRLPTEEEWQRAAQGGALISGPDQSVLRPLKECLTEPEVPPDGWIKNPTPSREYPWGDEEPGERANWDATGIGAPIAVGCFPSGKSPVGAEEMAGNVWEWTDSWYDESKKHRVLRGGSWVGNDPRDLRAGGRGHDRPGVRSSDFGFRLVCGGEFRKTRTANGRRNPG